MKAIENNQRAISKIEIKVNNIKERKAQIELKLQKAQDEIKKLEIDLNSNLAKLERLKEEGENIVEKQKKRNSDALRKTTKEELDELLEELSVDEIKMPTL